MTITVSNITRDAANVRIRVDTEQGSHVLRWCFETTPDWPQPNYAEAAAIALMPYAQRSGSDLRIRGVLSSSLLANLEDYGDYWVNREPTIFDTITILPDEIDDDPVQPDETTAVLALSGGVHSTYSLLSSGSGPHDERTRKIAAAVYIEGLGERSQSRNADTCRAICVALGTPFSVISTNWYTEFAPHSSVSFAAGIAATLRLFTPIAGQGIIAATQVYGSIDRPAGSNPTSNGYLGDLRFPIRSSGFGIERRTKAAAIRSHVGLREYVDTNDRRGRSQTDRTRS